jgi:membrane-bound inhibitor of C-type lysozyme
MSQYTKLNYIRIAAIIITLGLLFVGFYYNKVHPIARIAAPEQGPGVINDVIFACDGGEAIHAAFLDDNTATLDLSDGRSMTLPQVISASGARYANADESFVFWNKGATAFVTESGSETYSNCSIYNG